MRYNFVRALLNIFKIGRRMQELNSTFNNLVPKFHTLSSFGEYRHIALCGVFYKCIVKILMIRMLSFMHQLVSLN